MNSKTLHVTSSQDESTGQESTFVIDDEIRSIDKQDSDQLIFELRRIEIDNSLELPLYDLLSNQLWSNNRQRFGKEPSNMHILILLAKRLRSRIEAENIDRVVCHNLADSYDTLVTDICRQTDIKYDQKTRKSRFASYYEMIKLISNNMIFTLFLFTDQLFSWLFARFLDSDHNSSIAVMFPAVRPKTYTPLYDNFSIDFDTIYTLRTLGYALKYRTNVPASANLRFVNRSVSGHVLLAELKLLVSVYSECLFSRTQPDHITEWIHEREGVYLKGSVRRLYTRTALPNIDTLFTFILARRFFAENEYEKLLVPGLARTSRALSYAASDQGVDIFHLHHGIGGRRLIDDTLEQTRFTPGKLNKQYIESSNNMSIRPVPVGLPKHQYILGKRNELVSESSHEQSGVILIATQPFLKKVREEFLFMITDVVINQTEYDILIKPHPGETMEYYTKLLQQRYDDPRLARITVANGKLYEKLHSAELTVTVNSNVGIESLIMNTPVITYNPWTPDIESPLYVERGPVLKCESQSEFRSLLQKTDVGDLLNEQQDILNDDYHVYGNSVEQITQKIQKKLQE